MDCILIYFHRIDFPSASGQTIAILRDYFAMSETLEAVHLFYRSPVCFKDASMNDSLNHYGAKLTSSFKMHCMPETSFARYRLKKRVIQLIKSSDNPVIIATRILRHARTGALIRNKFSPRPIKVVLELHHEAFPHMVYQQQNRDWKAFLSLKKEKKIISKVDGIVCTAPPQLTILDQKFPHHAPAIVLPSSYDATFFQFMPEKSTQRRRNTFHIRYAGQFSIWKNTDVMIEALKFLPDNVVLDVAGGKLGANEATKKMLAKQSQIHGVQSRVNCFGFLPPKQVSLFLAEADCLVLPLGDNVQSRFFTSPIKLFEYAASNVPMVVSRQPTTLSLIEDGVHALMVKPDSPQDLARAVINIMNNYNLGRKLADNAKEWVARYSTQARTVRYKYFLDRLMDKI